MQSMTGYGRNVLCRDGREIVIEVKSVNHRFLDIAFRLPKTLLFLEEPLRKCIVSAGLCRGHIEVFAAYQNNREDARQVHVDMGLFRACARACEEAKNVASKARKPSIAEIFTLCGALTVTQGEEDIQEVTQLAQEALDGALIDLMGMRLQEGEALKADLLEKLQRVERTKKLIATRAPEVPDEYRERLNARLMEWNAPLVDPQRIAQEVALLADRCAVDEELSRLGSHIDQFSEGAGGEGEVGRRLEFLLQEMNREVNTIGSKASDESIARYVVDAKCLLEKLREQVQNVV